MPRRRRVLAMVARRGVVVRLHRRELANFEVDHVAEQGANFKIVFVFAGDLAGLAANARILIEIEAHSLGLFCCHDYSPSFRGMRAGRSASASKAAPVYFQSCKGRSCSQIPQRLSGALRDEVVVRASLVDACFFIDLHPCAMGQGDNARRTRGNGCGRTHLPTGLVRSTVSPSTMPAAAASSREMKTGLVHASRSHDTLSNAVQARRR